MILEDSVINILNGDFNTIKTALDDKTADSDTEKTMKTLEKNLEGYRQQNEQYLTEQRMAIMDYHNEMVPQESQDAWDKLLSEYQELFDAVKYKDANAKLAEVNTAIMAFFTQNATEVASNDTGDASAENGNNNNNGNAGNSSNSGNGAGNGHNGNGSATTGNGSGNNGNGNGNSGSGNSGSGNSGNGNTGSGNNNGGNGNTGNGGTSTPETPVEQPTGNGWSQEERNIISAIYVKWANFEYTDDEAQAQLAAQLPGRTCTLVHYPPERNAEAEELWRSLDENVYCVTGKISDDVDGTYFIYGR